MSELHSPVQFIALDDLVQTNVDLGMLAYPAALPDLALQRVSAMIELGVSALAVKTLGEKRALHVVGKGVRGVVVLGLAEGCRVAVKLLRTDASVKSMEREATMHSSANSVGVGPRLFNWSRMITVMEYVEGSSLGQLIATKPGKQLRSMFEDCLNQAYALDSHGLDHGQLSNASDHVIVSITGAAYIIDFSHSSALRKPSNVTSLISYLLNVVAKNKPKDPQLLSLLKLYKQRYSRDLFDEVKSRALNLLGEEPIY
ncbi:MAG: RIO1 family regulatory kinase/ATPase [Candidatus Caldarchaeum sp.]